MISFPSKFVRRKIRIVWKLRIQSWILKKAENIFHFFLQVKLLFITFLFRKYKILESCCQRGKDGVSVENLIENFRVIYTSLVV